MATFPTISERDYSIRQGPYSLEQEPIPVPRFEFQFSSNFDFYPVGKQDFTYLDPPYNLFATIRPDIASCLWETLKMKIRYILTAARNGNSNAASDLLTTFISSAKLKEIDMLPPPFPPAHQLASNPFLRPGHPAIVDTWVTSWQSNSRMLAAWIAKAQENSIHVTDCTWVWPATPFSSFSDSRSIVDTESEDLTSTAAELDSPPVENPTLPSSITRSLHVQASMDAVKRPRDHSPLDSKRDGDDASKKQLVLWRPSIQQLLEARQILSTGEVASGQSISSTPRVPPSSPVFASDPRLRRNNSHLHPDARVPAKYALTDSIARLERLHNFVHGASST